MLDDEGAHRLDPGSIELSRPHPTRQALLFLDDPEIADAEYDALVGELMDLEAR